MAEMGITGQHTHSHRHTHILCPLDVKTSVQTDTYMLSTGLLTRKDYFYVFFFLRGGVIGFFLNTKNSELDYHLLDWSTEIWCSIQAVETQRWREGGEVGGGWGKQCQSHDPSSHIPPQSFVFTPSYTSFIQYYPRLLNFCSLFLMKFVDTL